MPNLISYFDLLIGIDKYFTFNLYPKKEKHTIYRFTNEKFRWCVCISVYFYRNRSSHFCYQIIIWIFFSFAVFLPHLCECVWIFCTSMCCLWCVCICVCILLTAIIHHKCRFLLLFLCVCVFKIITYIRTDFMVMIMLKGKDVK